jgi:DNA-binding response OmpR family regulator
VTTYYDDRRQLHALDYFADGGDEKRKGLRNRRSPKDSPCSASKDSRGEAEKRDCNGAGRREPEPVKVEVKEKKHILIIEDERDLAVALGGAFELQGFRVSLALDGLQGVKLARHEKPDLIILDVMLPKVDGYKICRLLKFDTRYRHIPIIMLTIKGEGRCRQIGKAVGADAYMTKPFTLNKLLARVLGLLGEKEDEADDRKGAFKERLQGTNVCVTKDARRRQVRVAFGLRVFGQQDWLIMDLSVVGCFITTSQPLPTDSKVDLCFQIPMNGQYITIKAEGLVRRNRPGGMGVEFVDLDPYYSQCLLEFINTCHRP